MVTIRQAALLVLMTGLVFLAGCSRTAGYEDQFETWRSEFLSVQEHEITAEVTFSSGEKVCSYTRGYVLSGTSETIEVIAPELISEVKANISDGGSELVFDGAVLETGCGTLSGFSPLTALPTFMDFIEDGHLENLGKETEEGTALLVAELELPDGSRMIVRLTEAEMEPVSALIRSGDTVEAKIIFEKIM